MTREEQRNRRREHSESSANPQYNFSHVKCKRCGKQIYAPMPSHPDIEDWGCHTWTILIIAYLESVGWFVVKTGVFGGDFVCPDCIQGSDNKIHPLECAKKANVQYREWVEKMRQKYQYFEHNLKGDEG